MKYFLSLLFLGFTAVVSAEVTVNVAVSRRKVYQGESLNLNVQVNGADRGYDAPDTSALDSWAKTQLLDSRSNSRSSITVINGRMTRESFEGRVFTYQVTPVKTGSFRTGPIRVRVGGKLYEQQGAEVLVSGIEKQDTVIAAVKTSSATVLVEEPFTITLSVAVRDLPDPYGNDNESIHPNLPPHLAADFLEIRPPDPSLKGPDLNQVLNGLIDRRNQPAFSLNEYQSRNMMGGGFASLFGEEDPFRPRPIRFRFPCKRIKINEKSYREYTLSLNYVPAKEGDFTFGPVTFKGTVLTGVRDDRTPETADVYTIGPAVTVRVVPPPDEGRPESFIGAVGKKMTASAAFDTAVCKVGDPLQLTLEVTGNISVSNLRTPVLNLQTNLTHDFRIYDESVKADTLPNGKRFLYRVRPTHAGTLEFPSILLSYYDTDKKAYTTISTAPIPVQAQATTQIATEEGKNLDAGGDSEFMDVQTAPKASGITLSQDGVKNVSLVSSLLPPKVLWTLFLAGPLLALFVWLIHPVAAGLRRLSELRRKGGALGRARRALTHARNAQEVSHAVRDYLAKRLGARGAALTPDDAARLLTERGCEPDIANACRTALAALDEALYRPDSTEQAASIAKGLCGLLPRMDASLAAKKGGAPSARTTALILFFFLLPVLVRADDSSMRAFLWEQAGAQAASARTPTDYLKAAGTYNRLVADGAHNGPLFLNLGHTLVMAGDGANAVAAYTRAERYLGASPETRQGLSAALALEKGASRADLPWSRTAFFWHYEFPCSARAAVAIAGWCLFWLGVVCRILLVRHRRTRRGKEGTEGTPADGTLLRSLSDTCMVTGALICLAFSASCLNSLAGERHDSATWLSRVFQSVAMEERNAE